MRHTAWLGERRERHDLHEFVANFMDDTGSHWLWPDRAHDAIRMVLYELILNALGHGGAQHLHLRARGHRIDLVYRGPDFDPNALLRTAGNGGAAAMAHLRATLGDSLAVAYRHNGSVATIRLIDVASAGPSQPCGVRTSDLRPGWELRFTSCDTVHVFGGGLMSFSDLGVLQSQLQALGTRNRVVLHGLNAALEEFARQRLPNVSVAPGRK